MRFFYTFFSGVNRLLNSFLMLFGFRWFQNRWGVVYDSVSKQPLDPVQIKLIDASSGKVAQSSVTDLSGRYGFLATPGKFKIFVSKTNYAFPSKSIRCDSDGIYKNLYGGQLFELLGESDVISFNIPMDPLRVDWNQQAKQSLIKTSAFSENLALKTTSILFWAVFIFALASLYFSPSNFVYGILVFYCLVLFLAMVLPKPRLWGRVMDGKTKQPLVGVIVELTHTKFPDVVVAKGITLDQGKFFLRAHRGEYLIKITSENEFGQKSLLKSKKIKIGGGGYYSRDIMI